MKMLDDPFSHFFSDDLLASVETKGISFVVLRDVELPLPHLIS